MPRALGGLAVGPARRDLIREDEVMATQHLDSLVARGNTSDAYGWGKDAIIKVLRPEIPEEWAAREAETTSLVHAAGLPAPAVLDVTTVDGRPGIVFERIVGPSMWDQMLAHPGDVPQLASLLADLQAEVNATPAPAGIPRLIDRLHDKIREAPLLSSAERADAQAALERQLHFDSLCHFDVHPNNILMGPQQPIIIDWFDAAAGSPAADIVRSSLLMWSEAAVGHLPCMDPSLIDDVHDQYVGAVSQTRQLDDNELFDWETAVLASRLAEPVGDSTRRVTYEALQAFKDSQMTRLGLSLRSVTSRHAEPPSR